MKKLFIIFTFFNFLLLLNGKVKGQSLADVQQKFTSYNQTAVQEKLFVHTDKSFYLTGEILWLKIYNTDAAENKPLDVSKVAYVEIWDKQHNAVVQTKVQLKSGHGAGSVYLPVSLNNGNYKLRAYTNWMKNFSSDYYFEKNITIVNPLKSPEQDGKTISSTYDLQFFPEGGTLVRGINCKVGFKLINSDGKGTGFTGALLNQRNDTIVHFAPLKFGMGSFEFTPLSGTSYHAIVKIGGTTIRKELTGIADQGYNVKLNNNQPGTIDLQVRSTYADEYIYIFAQTRHAVKVVKEQLLTQGKAEFKLNTAELGEGISQITIFNSKKQPVAERLYFQKPKNILNISLSSDQPQYQLRKKVTLNITAKANGANPAVPDLSMSVFRLDSLQKPEAQDILSYLWLSSDLKGYIESPSYYFSSETKETAGAADNLMLTQGWRRFEWNNVLGGHKFAFSFAPEFSGHQVIAKITNSGGGEPAPNTIAYLGIVGKRVQMYPAKSDSAGFLRFQTKDFFGPSEMVIQTDFEKDSTYHIDVQTPFSEKFSATPVLPLHINPTYGNTLKKYSLDMQVQNIYAGAAMRKYLDPMVDSTAFYYKPITTYKLDDYTRFTTMEEDLREYVKEIYVAKRKKRFNLDVLGQNGFLREGNPLVMLDGIPVFNMDKVITIDPLKIQRLEVINVPYFYGPTINNGIMSYTSYKGDLGGFELDPRAVIVDYEGLQLQRKFYTPVYDNESQLNSRLPDYRNVLYWSPEISTSIGGQSRVSFYTGDEPGNYIAVIQGLTENGAAGSAATVFEVKK